MAQKSNRAGRAANDGNYSFRNLLLWNRGQELALKVVKLTEALPKTAGAGVMARQVVTAAASIPANIAEGHGRYSGLTSQMRALERKIASDTPGRIAEDRVEYGGDFELPDD